MLASYWHSADVRSILLDNSGKWPSCQMSETGYWIEGRKRRRLRSSNITFLPQKLLPLSKRASERAHFLFCGRYRRRARAHFLAPPSVPTSLSLSFSRFHLSMRAATTNAAVVFGNFRHMPRPPSVRTGAGKERAGKKLAISSSLLVRCRSGDKRGRCRREQIAANASSVCNTPRNALSSPSSPHRTIIAAARTL